MMLKDTNGNEAIEITSITEFIKSTKDLSGLDLSGFNLGGNDFTGYNFNGSNLSGCRLRRCTFTNATLDGANLLGAKVNYSIGNGVEIKNIELDEGYLVTYTSDAIAFDCTQYSIKDWLATPIEDISKLDVKAKSFYDKFYKKIVNEVTQGY